MADALRTAANDAFKNVFDGFEMYQAGIEEEEEEEEVVEDNDNDETDIEMDDEPQTDVSHDMVEYQVNILVNAVADEMKKAFEERDADTQSQILEHLTLVLKEFCRNRHKNID